MYISFPNNFVNTMPFKNLRISVNKNYWLVGLMLVSVQVSAQQTVLRSQTISHKSTGRVVATKNIQKNFTENAAPIAQMSSAEEEAKAEKVIIVNKNAPVGVDVNFLPLFGGFEKTENQQVDDQLFLSDCDKNFKNRKEAGEFFSKMGWDYLSEGEKNTAIHRFNLSYLLDNENIDAYWGLGVIEYQQENYSSAIKLMSKGLELCDGQNYVLMVDLATVYIKTALANTNSVIEINQAKKLLQNAVKIQPNYSLAYVQLAVVYLFENQPDEAWNQFHKGYELNPAELNREVLAELLSRKDDPKGIFKK